MRVPLALMAAAVLSVGTLLGAGNSAQAASFAKTTGIADAATSPIEKAHGSHRYWRRGHRHVHRYRALRRWHRGSHRRHASRWNRRWHR